MKKSLLLVLTTSAFAPALVFAPAAGASASAVLSDCNSNGYLTGHYSRSDLQSALNGMGADVKEYTNCYDVIRRALDLTAAGGAHHGNSGSGALPGLPGGGGSGGSGSGGSGGAGVSSRGVYGPTGNTAPQGPGVSAPVHLDGGAVSPGGGSGVGSASDSRSLPAGLIVVLILLGIAALGGGGVVVRRQLLPGPAPRDRVRFAGLRRVLSRSGG